VKCEGSLLSKMYEYILQPTVNFHLFVELELLCSITWHQILANNQLDALFHVFLFHLSACFEHHSAHHQEIKLY
jgi:hypothetical protein